MIVTPKLYGRYLPLSNSGHIINDRAESKIQPQWRPLLDDVIELFKEKEPKLHSIYIRGSVADGRAIDGISDIDSLALLDTDEDAPMLDCSWIEEANQSLGKKYPFCDGVETYLLPKERALSDRKSGFYIQSQSICIYGEDIIPRLSPYRVGEDSTFSHAKNLEYDLRYIRQKLYENSDPDFVKTCCKKVMKRIVRAAMESCMVEQNRYTRDLFLSNEMFALSCPEESGRIAKAMHYALNPTEDQGELLQVIAESGDFLVHHIQQKYGKETRGISFIDDFGYGDDLEAGMPNSNGVKWHRFDRSLDPVEASIEFGKGMANDNRDPVLFSVGSETQKLTLPDGGGFDNCRVVTSPSYNKQGGEGSLREEAASWVRRFMGIPAFVDNTFILQQNGRVALSEAFTLSGLRHDDPGILVPELRWPMLSQKIQQARMNEYHYEIGREGTSDDVVSNLQTVMESGATLSTLYTNYPHNPTGLVGSKKEVRAIVDALDRINSGRSDVDKVSHVIDSPYFAGCSQKDRGAYLKNPYEGNLAYDGQTPWQAVLSFSKAFGVASPGITIVVTDKSTQTDFDKQLVSGVGISYNPEFLNATCAVMGEEHDQDVLKHFDALRQKYEKNRSITSNSLERYMLDGDANLTTVLEFPMEFVGREIQCSDGVSRPIQDMNDLVEIFGNAGVVAVNCSTSDRNLVRLAMSGAEHDVQRGVNLISDTVRQIERSI